MKCVFFILGVIVFSACGSPDNSSQGISKEESRKAPPAVLFKEAPFIQLALEVSPLSSDSIMVKTRITNNWSNELVIYKPLLPADTSSAELLHVRDVLSRQNLAFDYSKGNRKETSDFLVPKPGPDHYITLQPGQSVEVISNIAHKYDFEKYLKEGRHEFSVAYYKSWPYVVNEKLAMEMDSVDQQIKPVYFAASMPEKKDPDSERVYFKVP